MLSEALSAKIPIIGVTSDDPVNFPNCLALVAGRKTARWPAEIKAKGAKPQLSGYLYWDDTLDPVSVSNYNLLVEQERQLVVLNPDKRNPLVFDAGVMPTPSLLVQNYLQSCSIATSAMHDLLEALKGLSLKTATEIVQLTMARTGAVTPKDVRHTRAMVGGSIQGLQALDTDLDFYVMPEQIRTWLGINSVYFLNPKSPPKLVPRGLLFAGAPGVGKTMAARAIANHLRIPLFRLNVTAALSKFVGKSEEHVREGLVRADNESPCVLLLDEVEKLFVVEDHDTGVTKRVLSDLLWWLAEHRSRVLTIMTTNQLAHIPKELYREGRVNEVVELMCLTGEEARAFALEVYRSIMPHKITPVRKHVLYDAIPIWEHTYYTHAQITNRVYELIKANSWYPLTDLESMPA